jgi:hypothetical protein
VVIFLFFKRFALDSESNHSYRRPGRMPTAEIVGHDEHPLTYDTVAEAFERSEPPVEQPR